MLAAFSIVFALLTILVLYIIDNEEVNKWVILFCFISPLLLFIFEVATNQTAENNKIIWLLHETIYSYLITLLAFGVFLDFKNNKNR